MSKHLCELLRAHGAEYLLPLRTWDIFSEPHKKIYGICFSDQWPHQDDECIQRADENLYINKGR